MARTPPTPTGARDTKDNFLAAERWIESRGNYQAVNPNSGALGAWQVMPANLPGWLRESDQRQLTPYQFLHNPTAQNRLAFRILGGYYDRYGAAGAAAMWYSGQPDPTKRYGDPPVYRYVANVLAEMGIAHGPVNYGPAPGGPAFNLPPPSEADWSGAIRSATAIHAGSAATIGRYAAAIARMT